MYFSKLNSLLILFVSVIAILYALTERSVMLGQSISLLFGTLSVLMSWILAQKIWDIISLPTCISHPLTTNIKELLGENRPFDLPHFKTILKKRYESIPGLRISEFNKTHKKVNVNCEMEMWLTIGQLKLLDKNTVNGLHAIVYTPVGQMEI